MRLFLVSVAAAAALLVVPAAMAANQTERIFEFNGNGVVVTVDVSFDNATGEVSGISWVVPSGTLKMTIDRPGQPSATLTRTSSGSASLPAGRYFLVQDRGGGWAWRQTSYSIGWNP